MAFKPIQVSCKGCGATIEIDPSLRIGTCSFCGAAMSVGSDQLPGTIPPVDYIFEDKVSEPQFLATVKKFLCDNPDTPDELYDVLEALQTYKCFLPIFKYDVEWHASWSAEAGYNRRRRENGREIKYVEWTPCSGNAEGIHTLCAPGSSTLIKRNLVDKVIPLSEALPLRSAVAFEPDMLAGSTWLSYDMNEREAYGGYVEARIDGVIDSECRRHIPGNTNRNLAVSSRKNYTLEKFVIPFWIFHYSFKEKQYVLAVDAVNGNLRGEVPHIYSRMILPALMVLVPLISWIMAWQANSNSFNFYMALPFMLMMGILPLVYRIKVTVVKKKFKDLDASGRAAASTKLKIWEKTYAVAVLPISVILMILFLTSGTQWYESIINSPDNLIAVLIALGLLPIFVIGISRMVKRVMGIPVK